MATDDSQRSDQKGVSLEDAMQAVVRAAIANLHTALPGIIQSFNPTTQTARVTPAVKRVWLEEGPLPLPDCVDVPVQFPGGGGYVITLPVKPGDECLLVFSERAIDAWFARGGVQAPSVVTFHDLSDAFALMGFRSKPHAIAGVSGDGLEIRTIDGQTMFRLENGTAYVGGTLGAEPAILGESFFQALDVFLKVLSDSHTGVASLPQVAAAINLVGPAAEALSSALTACKTRKAKVA